MSDRELILVINQAIPLRTCAQDKQNDLARRAWLLSKIQELIRSELSKQFNAKVVV